MHILITGGSGYLGTALTQTLFAQTSAQVTWVSRNANIHDKINTNSALQAVHIIDYEQLKTTTQSFDIIINLAGAGIADSRWSDKRKQQLYTSRLQPTQAVLDYMQRTKRQTNMEQPKLFISGSAIGWYGAKSYQTGKLDSKMVSTTDDADLTEKSDFIQDDFAHQLCNKWENLATTATQMDIPVVIVRTGVVLNADGGMIAKLKLPFSLGLGGRLGNGKQLMSWISRHDWVRAVMFIIEHHLSPTMLASTTEHDTRVNPKNMLQKNMVQIYNLTAPVPVTNAQFTQAVGNWLKRPTLFAQPNVLLKLIFGEMSTLLIDGQRVVPEKLLQMGFVFEDQTVADALIR